MVTSVRNVDEYIGQFPVAVQKVLSELRATVKRIAPDAEESISYGMPAYKWNGKPLVYFAGYKNHIGLYATASGHAAFRDRLSGYKQGKGSVQFPLDEPMPWQLVQEMITFRMQEKVEGKLI